METEILQQEKIENYIFAYNNFDVAGMIKDLHQDILFENIQNNQVNLTTKGVAQFKLQAEKAKEYFTQREQKILSWIFTGNKVAVSIDYQGILALDLPNGMKAGDTLRLKGKSVFEFLDGQIWKIQDIS